MKTNKKENFDHIFNLSPYIHLPAHEVGDAVFDLLTFLYDIRDLPQYQAQSYAEKVTNSEEMERINDLIYTTKVISDNFLMVAPILLYRLIESNLKKYLLILYEDSLQDLKKGNKTFHETIMRSNINEITIFYLESKAELDIKSLASFKIIEEIRELNNSLKHNNDYVNEKLNNENNYWKTDTLITVDKIQERVSDFNQGVNCFFYNLVNDIKSFYI